MSARLLPPRFTVALSIAWTVVVGASAWGQAPATVLPNPQAPTLAVPVPLGMQRGTGLDLTLAGTNLSGPTQVWTSFPAKVTIPADKNNGKDNASLRIHLDVPKGAPLGYHTIRLATTRGLSNFRLFCIDDMPQILETATNHSKTTAQAVTFPSVVVGRADAETSDYFKVAVKAGERVSFEVLGRRLGSLVDPQITLYDAKTGSEMPDAHSNDSPGCQTDPRLTYTFKEAGAYLVEIRDVMFRGGADFWYRLRIGNFPCATSPIPMAARRGAKVSVSFAGPTVDGVAPVEVNVPVDLNLDTVWVAPRGSNGLYGWPVALALSNHDEVVEQEPNDQPAKANRIPVPGGITGRFEVKGDVDSYVFAGKKGLRYVIEGHTHELYSPSEVYMTLKDAKGAQLGVTNPTLPPRIEFTAAADGDFHLSVEHLLYWGGPAETYRVTVEPAEADFDLTIGIDRFDVPQGGAAAAILMVARRGYTGPIEVSVIGPAGIGGQVTIAAGQPAAPTIPAGTLMIQAKDGMPMGAYPILVQGKTVINGKTITRLASVRAVVSLSLGGLPYPPRHLNHQLAVAVTEKPPFTLIAKLDRPDAVRGIPAAVTVTAVRTKGFTDPITLTPFGLPPSVPAVAATIPVNQTQVKIALNLPANVPLGTFSIGYTGRSKFQNRDFSVTSMPTSLPVVLPFDLKAEPAVLSVAQGAKAKLKVTAVRKGGYAGPIALLVRNLPPNVTAPAATIAAGQAFVEVELTAAPTAAPVNKPGIDVLGTATAAANQQNAAPPFTLAVVKK
jgi:hypothetical protein